MTHNTADTMAMRALILAVQAEGGRLEVPDHGQPLFQDLQVSWSPGKITLQLGPIAPSSQLDAAALLMAGDYDPPTDAMKERKSQVLQALDEEALRDRGWDIPRKMCDDCPPVGSYVGTRCCGCPRQVPGEHE